MGFLWSQDPSKRSNCAQHIDPTQGGVSDHKHESWSLTSYRNILISRLWHAVSWTCLLTCSFFNKQLYFHFDETKNLKHPNFYYNMFCSLASFTQHFRREFLVWHQTFNICPTLGLPLTLNLKQTQYTQNEKHFLLPHQAVNQTPNSNNFLKGTIWFNRK